MVSVPWLERRKNNVLKESARKALADFRMASSSLESMVQSLGGGVTINRTPEGVTTPENVDTSRSIGDVSNWGVEGSWGSGADGSEAPTLTTFSSKAKGVSGDSWWLC